MRYDTFISAIGTITLATDGKALTALHIQGDRYFKKIPKDWTHDEKSPVLRKAKKELERYFMGSLRKFSVPVRLEGTAFEKAVWKEISKVPYGMTVSYGVVAAAIGKPKAVRAVGTAVGHNPVCIIIPCHRILPNSGKAGDYAAGTKRKEFLLDRESPKGNLPKKAKK